MLSSYIFALTAVGIANASPLWQRQELPSVSAMPNGVSVVPAAPSSVVAPLAPSAMPSDSAADTTYPSYPCPDGFNLTYVEEQESYPYSIDVLINAGVGDWSRAP